jgi:crossover junction endodeoxyribonuclease RusA
VSGLLVRVVGLPAPQGSKRHVGNGVMIESSANVAPWRVSVAFHVRQAMIRDRHAGWTSGEPVFLIAAFYLTRPRTVRRDVPSVRPDLDKLLRATLDGLTTSGVVGDDAQIVTIMTSKDYAADGDGPGAVLTLTGGEA